MLAMALLLPGGHLGGLGGTAREVGGSREGVLTPPTVPDGFRWGVETGELAHLLPPCLFLAFARPNRKPPKIGCGCAAVVRARSKIRST